MQPGDRTGATDGLKRRPALRMEAGLLARPQLPGAFHCAAGQPFADPLRCSIVATLSELRLSPV